MGKKRWVKQAVFFMMISLVLFVSGCGAGKQEANEAIMDSSEQYSMTDSGTALEEEKMADNQSESASYGGVGNGQPPSFAQEQMMIYRGNMQIEVKDIDEASDLLLQAVREENGYLINSNLREDEERFYAHYEFRVPVDGFHSLFDKIEKMSLGKITNQSSNGTDVTEEYVDLESRLKAKKIYEERLLDFLGKAEKTEDLLKISNDLNRVQEEIEQIQGRMKYLSYHASNSTLTVDMVQFKDKVSPTASTWEKASEGFKQSIQFLVDLVTAIFVWLVSFLPILVLLVLLFIVIWWVYRKREKQHMNKKTKEKIEKESNEAPED